MWNHRLPSALRRSIPITEESPGAELSRATNSTTGNNNNNKGSRRLLKNNISWNLSDRTARLIPNTTAVQEESFCQSALDADEEYEDKLLDHSGIIEHYTNRGSDQTAQLLETAFHEVIEEAEIIDDDVQHGERQTLEETSSANRRSRRRSRGSLTNMTVAFSRFVSGRRHRPPSRRSSSIRSSISSRLRFSLISREWKFEQEEEEDKEDNVEDERPSVLSREGNFKEANNNDERGTSVSQTTARTASVSTFGSDDTKRHTVVPQGNSGSNKKVESSNLDGNDDTELKHMLTTLLEKAKVEKKMVPSRQDSIESDNEEVELMDVLNTLLEKAGEEEIGGASNTDKPKIDFDLIGRCNDKISDVLYNKKCSCSDDVEKSVDDNVRYNNKIAEILYA